MLKYETMLLRFQTKWESGFLLSFIKWKYCYTNESILMKTCALHAVSSREVCGSNEANGA